MADDILEIDFANMRPLTCAEKSGDGGFPKGSHTGEPPGERETSTGNKIAHQLKRGDIAAAHASIQEYADADKPTWTDPMDQPLSTIIDEVRILNALEGHGLTRLRHVHDKPVGYFLDIKQISYPIACDVRKRLDKALAAIPPKAPHWLKKPE